MGRLIGTPLVPVRRVGIVVADRLLTCCAWCQRVKDDYGGWSALGLFRGLTCRVRFTYAICPDCFRRMRENAASPKDGCG